jgi:hypothetical protein
METNPHQIKPKQFARVELRFCNRPAANLALEKIAV